MNSRILILFFTIFSFIVSAQNSTVQFCNYLYSNRNYNDLQKYCQTLLNAREGIINSEVRDTVALYWVRAKLKLNITDTSIRNVKIESLERQFLVLKMYQSLYINDKYLIDYMSNESLMFNADSVVFFQIKSFNFLNKEEYNQCENLFASIKIPFSTYRDRILFNKLTEIIEYTKTIKRKSALKAALISCVVPGYGKKYAGLPGEAVSSILTNGVLGLVFAENIWRKGFKSPFTIGTGLLFSTFYISNIVGSYYSVKRSNLQQERIIDEKIHTTLDFWIDSYFE